MLSCVRLQRQLPRQKVRYASKQTFGPIAARSLLCCCKRLQHRQGNQQAARGLGRGSRDGQPLHLPGDNLLVNLDLGTHALPIGSRLRAGAALLEVTKKPHNGCKKFMARFGEDALGWINDDQGRARKLRGINCRVIEAGTIRVSDAIEIVPL